MSRVRAHERTQLAILASMGTYLEKLRMFLLKPLHGVHGRLFRSGCLLGTLWYVVRSSYGFIAIVVASEGLELL